jgi:hypothetical protein
MPKQHSRGCPRVLSTQSSCLSWNLPELLHNYGTNDDESPSYDDSASESMASFSKAEIDPMIWSLRFEGHSHNASVCVYIRVCAISAVNICTHLRVCTRASGHVYVRGLATYVL